MFNTLAAASFNAIGDYTKGVLTDGYPPKIIVHAMVGGLLSKATGGDFKTGALAAGVNEAVVVQLDKLVDGNKTLLTMSSQIVGVAAASALGDTSASGLQTGSWVAANATQYNYLEHRDVLSFAEDMKRCGTDERCQADKWNKEQYNSESLLNVEDAKNTYGPHRAREKSLQIAQSIETLMSVQCATATCESHKSVLLERSIDSYEHLSKVLGEWASTLDRLGLMGGAAAGKQAGARPVGVPERAELAQVQRAVEYLRGTKQPGYNTNKDPNPPSSGLVSGETKVVGTGKSAGNDGSFSVPKGYTQGADGMVIGPGGGIYKATGSLDSSGNQIYLGGNGNYYTLTAQSSTRIASPNPSLEIGATGRVGEKALKPLGGQSQVTFQTTQGARIVDQLAPGKIAHESKVGYTSLDTNTAMQIAKDAELLKRGLVNGVTWNFFKSPVTGRVGPAAALEKALTEAGIKIKVHQP